MTQENKTNEWEKKFDEKFGLTLELNPNKTNKGDTISIKAVYPVMKEYIKQNFISKEALKEILEEIENLKFEFNNKAPQDTVGSVSIGINMAISEIKALLNKHI